MSGTLHYRLVIRDPADTFDALVLSSHPDDDNPFLTAPPSGDGESLDPLAGKVAFAEYVFRTADASGTITTDSEGTTATARVITGILADSDGKWAGVNRKAIWYESTDNGSTWGDPVYAGWLTQAILTGGIEWALHIGDSDRRERQITAFTSLPSATGFSGQRLIGAPFAPSDNVAAHYPAAWRFTVVATGDSDSDLPDDAVLLRFVSGYAPEHLDEPIVLRTDSINSDVAAAINSAAAPYLQTTGGVSTFPALSAVLTTTGGTSVGSFTPYGTGGIYFLIGEGKTIGEGPVFFDVTGKYLALKWTGTLPSVGTQYDVILAVGAISETTPFWWQGHPVDLVAGLLSEAGLAYDATSQATVKAALGALYAQYRFTATRKLWDLCEQVAFGPCGFALRRNLAWEWEFFETRTIPSSEPSETIDESAMYDPERAIFDLGVDSQVTAVVWKLVNWVIGTATTTDGPLDRAQAQTVTATYVGESGDDVTYGEHQVVYDLPGTIVLLDGQAPAPTANIYHQTQSEIILTRWGRGVPSSEIATLRASGIAAKLGEFVVVDLDHKPTIDTGSTPTGVRGGSRICQVVHRTRDPAGPVLSLLDVATATTNALVPAFTLAQKTGDTRHTAQLTPTNSGDLTGYMVEVQVNTGASEPSGGTSLPLFAPDAVAHDLPAQLAGSTVWARARVVSGDELPGAWSDWDSVALDAVPPVTGLSNAAGANDTERVLTWTVGDASLPVRVRWKATADATYLHSITLPAGSNTYTITGIVPGTAMTAAVDHVEVSPFTGDSADETTTWTAGSTTPTLTAPINPQGFTDGAGTYGLRVTASVLPSRVVFMQAIEDSVGAGTYGTPVEVGSITSVAGAGACVITLTRPNDGLTVQLTAHHAKTGYTDSSDTTAVTLDPWETTATVPPETSALSMLTVTDESADAVNSRQIAVADGVSKTDAGAGSTLTLGLTDGGVALAKLASAVYTETEVDTLLAAKAPLASPALTGTPTAPTAAADTDTTQIATTAYVQTELDDYAPLASPALTGTPTAPTPAEDDDSTAIATTAYVQTELDGFTGGSDITNPMTATGDLIVGLGSDQINYATVAQGASVSTSAGTWSGAIANVIDENDTTYWESTGHFPGITFVVDLGLARDIAAFRFVQPSSGAGVATQIKLESSPDNTTWTQRYLSATGLTGGTLADDLDSSATARYWRWTGVAGNTSSGCHAQTLELLTAITITPGTPARLGVGADGAVLRADSSETTGLAWDASPDSLIVAVGDEATALTTGTAKVTFRMPWAMTLSEIRGSLTTASSSGAVTVDVNDGGTTILSTTLTIDASEKTSTTAATAAVISDTALADDAEITVDIDGAGTGAAGLKVTFIGAKA